jgi:hypothetical protein
MGIKLLMGSFLGVKVTEGLFLWGYSYRGALCLGLQLLRGSLLGVKITEGLFAWG